MIKLNAGLSRKIGEGWVETTIGAENAALHAAIR